MIQTITSYTPDSTITLKREDYQLNDQVGFKLLGYNQNGQWVSHTVVITQSLIDGGSEAVLGALKQSVEDDFSSNGLSVTISDDFKSLNLIVSVFDQSQDFRIDVNEGDNYFEITNFVPQPFEWCADEKDESDVIKRLEPTIIKKQFGWNKEEKPALEWWNYMLNLSGAISSYVYDLATKIVPRLKIIEETLTSRLKIIEEKLVTSKREVEINFGYCVCEDGSLNELSSETTTVTVYKDINNTYIKFNDDLNISLSNPPSVVQYSLVSYIQIVKSSDIVFMQDGLNKRSQGVCPYRWFGGDGGVDEELMFDSIYYSNEIVNRMADGSSYSKYFIGNRLFFKPQNLLIDGAVYGTGSYIVQGFRDGTIITLPHK